MKIELDGNGTLTWYNDDGRLHREDGPALICSDGTLMWFTNYSYHRDGDKPAIEWANGDKEWWVDGRRVR